MGRPKRNGTELLPGMPGRLKKLRLENGMTQEEFANKIGMSQKTYGKYELAIASPPASTVNNICKTFGIYEKWLRDGDGDMYVPTSKDEELTRYFTELMSSSPESFRYRLAVAVARLSEPQLKMLEAFTQSLARDADILKDEDQV